MRAQRRYGTAKASLGLRADLRRAVPERQLAVLVSAQRNAVPPLALVRTPDRDAWPDGYQVREDAGSFSMVNSANASSPS